MTTKQFKEAQRLAAIGKANYNNGIAKGMEMAIEVIKAQDGYGFGKDVTLQVLREEAETIRFNAHND